MNTEITYKENKNWDVVTIKDYHLSVENSRNHKLLIERSIVNYKKKHKLHDNTKFDIFDLKISETMIVVSFEIIEPEE